MTSVRAARLGAIGVLALLVIGAAVVRRIELGPPGLWNDDAWVALIARHAWRDIWFTSLTSVGFRALVGGWIALFGDSTLAAQTLPFAFGLAVIPATYTVARRLGLSRVAALFAAGLTAASPLLATYSTRVKQYTGDALFALAITASVAWVVRDPASARRWRTLTAVCCAAIAFSGQLALVVGPAVLVAVVGSRRSWRNPLRTVAPAVGVILAFAGAWYVAVLAPAISPTVVRFWDEHYIVLDEGAGAAARSVGRALHGLIAGAIGGARVNVAGAAVLAAAALAWRPAATAALLLPVLAAVGAAAAGRSPIGARTDTYLAPLIALVMAAGLDGICRSHRALPVPAAARYAVAIVCMTALIAGASSRAVPALYPRQDVPSLIRIWEGQRGPADHTFVYPSAARAFTLYSHEPVVTRIRGQRLSHGTVVHPAISVLQRRPRIEPAVYYTAAVRAAVGDGTARVWILAAQTRRGDLPALEAAVAGLGFPSRERWATDGDAELILYQRAPGR